MSDRNTVILVDEQDNMIGQMEKLEAHQKGVLHRAFSIFIFNNRGEMLLQQRASEKYHGANLWTNTCCSHPELNKTLHESAKDRLFYEMGIECDIDEVFSFIYKAHVENNLIEHEYDHVFVGYSDTQPKLNPLEVKAYKWIKLSTLEEDLKEHPKNYTYWFKTAFPDILNHISKTKLCS